MQCGSSLVACGQYSVLCCRGLASVAHQGVRLGKHHHEVRGNVVYCSLRCERQLETQECKLLLLWKRVKVQLKCKHTFIFMLSCYFHTGCMAQVRMCASIPK